MGTCMQAKLFREVPFTTFEDLVDKARKERKLDFDYFLACSLINGGEELGGPKREVNKILLETKYTIVQTPPLPYSVQNFN